MALIACIVLAFYSNAGAQSSVVRLQSVVIPIDSGLLTDLFADFEKTTGYHVQVTTTDQPYTAARQGVADLVLSHYGHEQVDDFMADGLGLWPRAAFASQSVLIGPATDPAGVRDMSDVVEAFRRIAQTKSRFIVNNAATEKYLSQMLFEGAGRPDGTGWYMDAGLSDAQAIQTAQRSNGYVLWGVIPFLKFKAANNSSLDALVLDDPLMQRLMMTVIVNPEKIAGVNVAGALALQRYLSSPAAQARIRAFRYPGVARQLFWPSAFDNIGSFLTDNTPLPTTVDPAVNSVVMNPATVRATDSIMATFAGANLGAETFFDVRFRRPGGSSDEIAQNWQQGTSASHPLSSGIPMGTWRITGVRAHANPDDHTGGFIPVTATITMLP